MGSKQAKGLTEEEIAELVEKTGLEKEVISAWSKQFLTECPSGRMHKRDFYKFYKSLRVESDQKVKRVANFIFQAFDKDHSGYIDFKEFIAGYAVTSQGDNKSKLEYIFAMYDHDKSNTLERKEVVKVIDRVYDLMAKDKKSYPPSKCVEAMFDNKITKTNDSITKEEFIDGCLKNPKLMEMISPFES